jgi:hypothetical protein
MQLLTSFLVFASLHTIIYLSIIIVFLLRFLFLHLRFGAMWCDVCFANMWNSCRAVWVGVVGIDVVREVCVFFNFLFLRVLFKFSLFCFLYVYIGVSFVLYWYWCFFAFSASCGYRRCLQFRNAVYASGIFNPFLFTAVSPWVFSITSIMSRRFVALLFPTVYLLVGQDFQCEQSQGAKMLLRLTSPESSHKRVLEVYRSFNSASSCFWHVAPPGRWPQLWFHL